jgi:hypothetical protein
VLGQERLRTGRQAVGAGEEDGDQVADLGAWRHDVVGEPVERRAEAASDRDLLLGRRAEPAGDRHRIVAAYHLAEIARGGELMVHAAVGDQEGLAVAELAVDDPGQIDARLADQPAAELDREGGVGQDRRPRRQPLGERLAHGLDVERRLAVEIGKAEAAAEIDQRRRRVGLPGELRRQLQRRPLRLDQRAGVERL